MQAARYKRRRASGVRLLQLFAKAVGAALYSVVALVATVAAAIAAVVAAPFLLMVPIAAVAIILLLVAYLLSGLGLV